MPGLLGFLTAGEQLGDIRGHVALQQIGRVKLPEQVDHLVLGGCRLTKTPVGDRPQIPHAVGAIHQRYHQASGGGEPVYPSGSLVPQQIPKLAPVAVTVHRRVGPQLRPHIRDPVPQRAE